MKLVGIELVRLNVPFRSPIGTSAGVHRHRDLLYVRVVAEGGEGWGECAALAERTSVDPSVGEVEELAISRGISRMMQASAARGGELVSSIEAAPLFGTSPADRMLGAAFEMAVSDVELRATGISLGHSLQVGPGFESMPVGVAIGIPEDRDLGRLRDEVAREVLGGAARVRLKIEPGWDVIPTAEVRSVHPELVLQLDANGAYGMDDVDQLNQLAEFGVLCLEQPMPPADLVAHAQLTKKLKVPVCLDESLSTPRRVLDAIRNESCQVACLKPARLGGIGATRSAHAACAAAGVSVFIGGFFETGLGRASNLALAARLAQDAPGYVSDLSDPATYLEADPCGYPEVHQGWVRVPDQPGVGTWPDDLELAKSGAQRRWFPATYT